MDIPILTIKLSGVWLYFWPVQKLRKLSKNKKLKVFFLTLLSVGGPVDGGKSGVFIKKIDPNSLAARSKVVFPGDQILEVGGVSITSMDLDDVAEVYLNSISPIELVVQSCQPGIYISTLGLF